MKREVDPAYFDPNAWTKVTADNPLDECYVHDESGTKVSPEKYHSLCYDAEVIDRADVTRNEVIRDIIDEAEIEDSWLRG